MFVSWLIEQLPRREFRLAFSASRFVPNGLIANVVGIERVLDRYVWRTSWKDNGEVVQSEDWHSTQASLQRLRMKLHEASKSNDGDSMLAACCSVLDWGGVSGARPFLRRKAAKGELIEYLRHVQTALDLNADGDIDRIDDRVIEQFDAGLTKIHALFDTTGSPIYDSRVGAAIAMLYAMYRAEGGLEAPRPVQTLSFPSGGARGAQVRNPNAIDARFAAAPQFYTAGVSHAFWAQSQVMLGWIMQEVLERTDWFARVGDDLPARCHAFEAALFMIGYDLRCLANTPCQSAPDASGAPRSPGQNWVPASHTFSTLFPLYVDYRKELGVQYDDVSGAGFMAWLNQHRGPYTVGALRAYCYPFRQTEFDLFDRSLDEILELHHAIDTGETVGIMKFLSDFAIQSDERRSVCLIDAWCVGYLRENGYNTVQSREILRAAGFAGTPHAAAALVSVGSNVGRYLRLIDEDRRPTALFHDYFADKLNDLAERLRP
jgi:hypothetical protein